MQQKLFEYGGSKLSYEKVCNRTLTLTEEQPPSSKDSAVFQTDDIKRASEWLILLIKKSLKEVLEEMVNY